MFKLHNDGRVVKKMTKYIPMDFCKPHINKADDHDLVVPVLCLR